MSVIRITIDFGGAQVSIRERLNASIPSGHGHESAAWHPCSTSSLAARSCQTPDATIPPPLRHERPRSASFSEERAFSHLGLRPGIRSSALILPRTTYKTCAFPLERAARRVRLLCLRGGIISSNATRHIDSNRPWARGSSVRVLTTIGISFLGSATALTASAFSCIGSQ